MSNLSQDDLLYGTARRLISENVYGIEEGGEFNLQPGSSTSVMTMTNFTGEEAEEDDCEQCGEALDNCIEDKKELVETLKTCNTNLESCTTLNIAYYNYILTLQGLYCAAEQQARDLMPTPVSPNGYFEALSASCSYQIGDRLPVQVDVSFSVYEDADNPLNYLYYYTSSSSGSSDKWLIEGGLGGSGSNLVLGPIDSNTTGSASFQFRPDINCNYPLTLKTYSSLFPQFSCTTDFGELPCPTGEPEPPCPAPPIPE